MRTVWSFHSAVSIVFGQNSLAELPHSLERLGGKRILIITDPILVKAGLLEKVRQPLIEKGLTVDAFTGSEPEPSFQVADKCMDQARAFKPDIYIGLGGGSNMDLSKICATLHAHPGSIRNYMGDGKIPGPIAPLICIPTTSGTGSEVSAAAVLTDTENKMKVGILSNFLRPQVALIDPLLTLSCPPKVTADSGIDALTHAIEAFTAVDNAVFPLPAGERSVYQGKHPMGDMCAEKAITLVGQYLRRAVKDGKDLEARDGMALAATLGGLAFSNVGVAAVHALEYPIGGAVHCSHGAGNGLLLPYVMRFNKPARVQAFAQIAKYLGEKTDGLSEDQAAELAIVAVEKLRADIGIPGRLRELGVQENQLRTFAEKAFAVKRILRVNPRPVTAEDLEGILKSAF